MSLSESLESIKEDILNELTTEIESKLESPQLKHHMRTDHGIDAETVAAAKEAKYGDDELFESFADNNLFFPLATILVDPLRNMGLTPDHVTYLSTIMTFISIYFLNIDNNQYAAIAYLTGYLLDCVDGKMARKYNMSSKYGMALDLVSDNISNMALGFYLITRYGLFNHYNIIIIGLSYMLGLSYGINEAIASHRKTGSDNFYENAQKNVADETDSIFSVYLKLTETSYQIYKKTFPEYNETKLYKWLNILKHFGPGNYCMIVAMILLNIEDTK